MHEIKSLTQQVYDYIVNQIKLGNLRPGEKINEANLIDTLKISRTPIREALILLSSNDILDNIPRKGFFVKTVSNEKINEAFVVVGHLDSIAAGLALKFLKPEELENMDKLIEQAYVAISTQDYKAYLRLQENFHKIYLSACNNKVLINTIDSLFNKYIYHTYYSDDKEKLFSILKEVNDEHKKIVDYFINGDEENLKKSIYNHWQIAYPDQI